MGRNMVLLLIVAFVILGGVVMLAQTDAVGPAAVSTEESTRIEAPGTTVETDGDKTRVQAPGVDITVPRNKNVD